MTVRARHTPREKVECERYVGLGETWLSVVFELEAVDYRCRDCAQNPERFQMAEAPLRPLIRRPKTAFLKITIDSPVFLEKYPDRHRFHCKCGSKSG